MLRPLGISCSDLMRLLPSSFCPIEVTIETHDDEIVLVGRHILISIIEIQSELFRPPGNIGQIGWSKSQQRDAAGKKQVFGSTQKDVVKISVDQQDAQRIE